MTTYEVHNQKELDAAIEKAVDGDRIYIVEDGGEYLQLKPSKAHVEAWESSHVVAWGSSHVVAWGSSHVVAWGSSHVEAWESSHVVARESSHVEAWGSSHVVARESSHVEAWGSSHVVAWGSSHVEARESSHVEAWEFAVAVARAITATVLAKSTTAHAIVSIFECAKTLTDWLARHDLKAKRGKVVIYKRVSKEFMTQENNTNATSWAVGKIQTHESWNPTSDECGPNKYHACARPYFCDEFRSNDGDRYVAIEVAVKDLHLWTDNPRYPHKVAFRKGKVLYECDRYGGRIA